MDKRAVRETLLGFIRELTPVPSDFPDVMGNAPDGFKALTPLLQVKEIEDSYRSSCHDRTEHDFYWIFVRFFTKINFYTVMGSLKDGEETYMGGSVGTRVSASKDDWSRARDLPDGTVSRGTWEKIKSAIIKSEMTEVTAKG